MPVRHSCCAPNCPLPAAEQALQLREEMIAFVASESDKVPAGRTVAW